ncbi:MAG: hypothetical protein DYG94_03030 [Leptolyngbya sp. PLA3]|nr:MAG: hypothetical protein EDM82_11270 [Cyanobacteria bacterium CYA]MCE7967703.1 hypothetical protein [Leptolyngbya sp. PL-A3]
MPALLALSVSTLASADTIYQSEDPFGGFFGLWGADVFVGQTVGQRFTPDADYRLDQVRLWFMSNDFEGVVDEFVTVTIQTDAGGPDESYPSGVVLDQATFEASAIGWDPVEEVAAFDGVVLHAGRRYWVVCSSNAAGGEDPVWNFASEGLGFNAFRLGNDPWQPGGSGAELTMGVDATPAPCIPDFVGDGTLDFFDVQAFLARFSAGSPSVDLNNDGHLNFFDVQAFLTALSAGCP